MEMSTGSGEVTAPLVSIVIDNYNYGNYIADAIRSALDQTYPNIEVIVVDDGSTDHSRQVIESFSDARLRKIYQENRGQAAALNAGIGAARGEIVVLLDADDYLIFYAVATLMSMRTPATVAFHSRLRIEGPDQTTLGFEPSENLSLDSGRCDEILLKYGRYRSVPTSGKAFVRTALEKVLPIPEEYHISGDIHLQDNIAFYGEVTAIEYIVGVWRHHGKNNHNKHWLQADPERLRELVEYGNRRQQWIEYHGEKCGREVPVDLVFRDPYQMRPRVLLWKLYPQSEPEKQERFLSLAGLSFRAAWWYARAPLWTRCKHTLWFLSVFVLPRKCLTNLLQAFARMKQRLKRSGPKQGNFS